MLYIKQGMESRYPMELLAKGAALVMVLLTAMLLLCLFTWMNSADGFQRRRRNLDKSRIKCCGL